MMKRAGLWIMALGTLPLLSACSLFSLKPRPSVLPDYIHKISRCKARFTNKTQQYGLEDSLTLAAQSELNRDGRYQITNEAQADGVIFGDITRYILEPLSYDANHVPTEYKLTILASISFNDKVKNLASWTEPEMSGELRYFVSSSGFAGSMTEADARQVIFDEISRDIAKRTFEGAKTLGSAKKTSATSSTTSTDQHRNPSSPSLNSTPPPQPDTQPSAPSPLQQPY